MDEEKIIEERKRKFVEVIKRPIFWTIVFLIIAMMLGLYIRTLPMQDHTKGQISFAKFIFMPWTAFEGRPGLWNIAENNWTLGPDLDPWLFTRYAKEMIDGSFPKIDSMRNVPLGFNTAVELQMVSYMIVLTYKITNIFGVYNVNFAAALMPVILFLLTIISFFLFVREIFITEDNKSKIKANIISLIATFFMIVIPAFLSRTVAGIPEKESVGFFFMFLAFYLFLKAWKSKKWANSIIFAVFAGISTALMGLTWGGVLYIYTTIAVATLVAILLNKVGRKEGVIYIIWILISAIIPTLISARSSLTSFVTSLDTGLASFIVLIIIINFVLDNKKISEYLTKRVKLPLNIISLIIAIILGIIIVSLFFGPGFIIQKIDAVNHAMFNPVTGRWSTTVAENRQPYFQEWASEFGPFIKNIPLMFWLFFIGSVVLFKKMLSRIKRKDAWILTALYILFFMGLVFSRYAPPPVILNGEGFLSKFFYYGSALLFICSILYYYIKYEKAGDKGFEEINYEYILLFALFFFCLFTARSAVRLIMVLGPIAPIFAGFLIIDSVDRFRKSKDETWKIVFGAFMVLIIVASIFSFNSYYKNVRSQSYSFVPSYYNQQWQKAMKWIDNETPKDSVFAHWWDYGYWVQSIGDRATVTDGGNAIVYWNYLSGRLVLTGDNQADSLEFLYNHNASYLLIDSSDIGKYGAFSSIGSNKNFDRYSWIGTFLMDDKQTQETKNETLYVYIGGVALDEDLVINENGKEVLLPGQRTGVGAIIIPMQKKGNDTNSIGQPYAIMVYNGINHKVDLRYLSIDGKFIDFKTGIEASAYVFPQIISDNQGRINENKIGAIMFLSPRLLRGYLAQKYILDDPFNKFPNFKIVHKEQSIVVDSLNSQGMSLPDFVYFQGIQGPITVWKISYTGKEKINPEYLLREPPKSIDWEF